MRTDLMDVAFDIDRGLPRYAAVGRSRNSANMDVGQKHGAVARRRHRANSKGRSHHLSVDDRRSGVPFAAPFYGVETRQELLRAVGINAQNTRVIGPHEDNVTNRYAA
jgi:hypothetical protein